MSEDYQVQQPVQSSSYAGTGFVTGGLVGAAGGAYAAHKGYDYTIKTKPSLDKLFAQEPDVFTKNEIKTEGDVKSAWQTAGKWAKQIQEKDAEYNTKVTEITENIVPKIKTYSDEITKEAERLMKERNLAEVTPELRTEAARNLQKAKNTASTDAMDAIRKARELGIEIVRNGKKLSSNTEDWLVKLGTKEEYLREMVQSATNEIQPHLENLKLPSKTWTGLAAATILSIAGYLAGSAVKKDVT